MNYFLDNFLYRSVFNYRLFYYSFDFFNSVSVNNFFNNNLYFNRLFDHIMHLNNFLDYLRYFKNLLNNLDNRDNLLNDSINRFIPDFNVISDIRSWNVFNSFDNFLNNLLNFNNLWYFNSDFNYFFNYLINRDWLLDYLSCRDDFFSNQFNIAIFGNWNDDLLFDFSVSLNFDEPFDNLFNLNNFRDLSDNLNDFFNHFWYLNNSLFDSWNLNHLLYDKRLKSGNFDWNIYSILHNLIFLDFIWSLNTSLYFYNFRHLNDFLHNPLNNLFNFYNLRSHFVDF